jgi:predicted nucleic acid-binding Zn ribbon protein
MSPAAVIYKGSGFHTTDYARKSGGNGGGRDGDGKPEPSSAKDKSEGKPGTGASED